MGLRADVNYPQIDIEKTIAAIHEYMTRFTAESLKTYVITTSDLAPILYGSTKASFIKLANHVQFQIEINPLAYRVGRGIEWGMDQSTGELFGTPGAEYGFQWTSDIPYQPIIEERYGFVAAGEAAIANRQPELPPPVMESN